MLKFFLNFFSFFYNKIHQVTNYIAIKNKINKKDNIGQTKENKKRKKKKTRWN